MRTHFTAANHKAAEEVRITRKTLLEMPEPPPPAPPAATLPDHPAYQRIVAVFAAADAPMRARAVREAMDLKIAPNNINNIRLKLKQLVGRGILSEPDQGLFTQPRAPVWTHLGTELTAESRRTDRLADELIRQAEQREQLVGLGHVGAGSGMSR